MIDIIAGAKGKGKTKILIQQVNDDIKLTKGTIVYLDKNDKHYRYRYVPRIYRRNYLSGS